MLTESDGKYRFIFYRIGAKLRENSQFAMA